MSKPPIFFFAFANARSQKSHYLRNLPQEARQLELALKQARQAGLCELLIRHNVTAEEVFNTFQSDEYRDHIAVFHFAGHANGYQLLLESNSGTSEAAHAGGLAHLLGQQQGLQLVFLNGCSTTAQSQGLLNAGIPVVISTAESIDDRVATSFAQCFYTGLGSGASLQRAYREAEARIKISQTPAEPKTAAKRGVTREPETGSGIELSPWRMQVRTGCNTVLQWNLPDAADNPLFGLPELPPQDLPASPFRHLHAFRREHAAVFFGRGALIRAAYDRVTQSDAAPILLLCGQSGVGKSSVLAAGLLPRLQSHYQLKFLRRDVGQGLWATLCAALGCDPDSGEAQAAWMTLEQQAQQPLLMVFDQLEEVFTRAQVEPSPAQELKQFMLGLQQLFGAFERRPQGKLILSYRKEWSLELETALSDQRLPFSRLFVEPLDQRGMLEAITGPASTPRLQQQYGLSVEAGLATRIAHDLSADRESPIAPVLQILLTRMWDQVREEASPQFDTELYQRLKRAGLLLNDFLDQQFETLLQQSDCVTAVQSGLLLDLLNFHTTTRGTANERSQQGLFEAYAHQKTVCQALIEQCKVGYLLVSRGTQSRESEYYHRLCHDALAPLIRERFEASDRPGQRARRILESRAVEWQAGEIGTPLDAVDLTLVEQGAQGMRVWREDEQRLVSASRRLRQKRQRQRRVRRALGVLAIALILVTTALTGWQWRVAEQQKLKAQSEQAKAEHQNRLALARQLAAQAKIALDTGTGEGLLHSSLLTIESLKQAHTTQGTLAMAQAEALLPYSVRTLPTECPVVAVRFDPKGRWLATSERRWSTNVEGERKTTEAGYLISDPKCNQVRLWDPKTGQQIRIFKNTNPVHLLGFNPEGTVIAEGIGSDVLLLDTTTGTALARLNHDEFVSVMAFNLDGSRFATFSRDNIVRVFDTKTWQLITQLKHTEKVDYIEFSPDGKYLVTKDALLTMKDIYNEYFRFSPDGKHFVPLVPPSIKIIDDILHLINKHESDRLVAHVWDIETNKKIFQIYDEGLSISSTARKIIFSVKFTTDNRQLVSLGTDGYARFWEVLSGKELQQIPIISDIDTPSLSKVAIQDLFGRISIRNIEGKEKYITVLNTKRITSSLKEFSVDDRMLFFSKERLNDETLFAWSVNYNENIFRFPNMLFSRDKPHPH